MFNKLDSRLFGGTMLIAGTTIGAGMLAMPITTGLLGFVGTSIVLLSCWLFMYWIGTVILESSLNFEDGTNFFTMAKETLGPNISKFVWIFYLLLFYSLLAAYLSGSGKVLFDAFESGTGIILPRTLEIFPLLIIFAPFIYYGLSAVDHINRFLMLAMIISYSLVVIYLLPTISIEHLSYFDLKFSFWSISMVVASFGYHSIIPSLISYLDRDTKRIRLCLFYGSAIPLVIYLLWELVILGSLPVFGEISLWSAFKYDWPISKVLANIANNELLVVASRIFSIFAIVTSFLGVSQALYDFIDDGLKERMNQYRKVTSFVFTFLPPVLFILFFKQGFIILLEYAGALVSIILGIIPILILKKLRKGKKQTIYRAPGNNVAFSAGILFFVMVVILVILKNLHLYPFNMAY